ncbi:MAG: ImmA/IrrE family metallo-endopeptidase [Candidatus Krumholzibacteriia bacterium]
MDWDKAIPYLHPEDSRKRAEAFLADHNPEGLLPLPIEEIIEFKLGINIVPLAGLQGRIHTVGFTTSDLQEINVDLDVTERFPSRFRWTLAHEVGHVLLHRQVYAEQQFRTVDEWIKWTRSIPDHIYRRFEAQANTIAAQILIPTRALTESFEGIVAKLQSQDLDWTVAPDVVYRILGKTFGVAPISIRYALRNEGLAEDPREDI